MNIKGIFAQLDAEIERLQRATNALSGPSSNGHRGRRGRGGKRNLSPAARRRIAAAQKARWAKRKKVHAKT